MVKARNPLIGLFAALAVGLSALVSGPGGMSALVLDETGQGVAHSDGEPVVYGWSWHEVVEVFDGTPQPNNWRIEEAVAEWGKRSGLDIVMVSEPAAANIVVNEVYDSCGVTFGVVLGCAHMSGGVGVSTINLNPSYKNRDLAQHVGSHELGHTIGLAHAPTAVRSIMKPSVNDSTWLRAPQGYDYKDMQFLYGR